MPPTYPEAGRMTHEEITRMEAIEAELLALRKMTAEVERRLHITLQAVRGIA